jgi:hypothetical protein
LGGESSEPIPAGTPARDIMLLVLTCAAGLVDAISYLEMGHVFTAMMTGNSWPSARARPEPRWSSGATVRGASGRVS